MLQMSFGMVSILGGIFLSTCYLIGIKTRQFKGWIKREEVPETKYRHNIIIPVLFVAGLIFGSIAQPLYDKFSTCKLDNKRNKDCIIEMIYPDKRSR